MTLTIYSGSNDTNHSGSSSDVRHYFTGILCLSASTSSSSSDILYCCTASGSASSCYTICVYTIKHNNIDISDHYIVRLMVALAHRRYIG